MYPNLLAPLLIALAIAIAALLLVAVRQPVSRRLAFRQLARRRTEAALVISGSVLGTAIIVGAVSMPYAVAPEFTLLTGRDPRELREAHAEFILGLFLPPVR